MHFRSPFGGRDIGSQGKIDHKNLGQNDHYQHPENARNQDI